MQNVVSMVQSGGGEALLQHAEQRGLDPALLNGVMGIIRWGRWDGNIDVDTEVAQCPEKAPARAFSLLKALRMLSF